MTIRVELTAAEEVCLRERAAARGEAPETLASEMLRSLLRSHQSCTTEGLLPVVDEDGVFHQERWDAVMASIAKGSANAPALPPESLTREGLYQDHD